MASVASISSLPPEILVQVFDYLDRPAPSSISIHEQPHEDMLNGVYKFKDSGSDVNPSCALFADLKSSSCVSKHWRSISLPSLFRNVIWTPQITNMKTFSLHSIPMLQFLSANSLNRYVITFTLMLDIAADEADNGQLHIQIQPGDLERLWNNLFSIIDPLRFTIIAPPATLAVLMNRMLLLTDSWSFDVPYHILSLARSVRQEERLESGTSGGMQPDCPQPHERPHNIGNAQGRCNPPALPPASALFMLRPWTSILLNEGSSVRAYQTYEFFLRQPPSMLSALLGTGEYPNNHALLPPTITDFNYIAVFPLATHVHTLLANLPKLERLFVQLTPRPSNHILQDHQAMKNIDMSDLWLESNTSYNYILTRLTSSRALGDWGSLKVFESGDVADKESWDTVMGFLKRSGNQNWVVERDGVLCKIGDDTKPISSTGGIVHHLLGETPQNMP